MAAAQGNKYALGNNGGRPPKFSDVTELDNKIANYFASLEPEASDEDEIPMPIAPTVTGLALFLGFADKSSLYDYRRHENHEFSHCIKRALLVIENHYENRLNYQSPTGAIFALKNMNWSDKSEVEHTGKDGEPLALQITVLNTNEGIETISS